MIMMVVTVKVVVVQLADLNLVMTVNLIGLLTDLNAVIQHGMSMVLTAPHLKALMAGIAQVVLVLVIVAVPMAALTVAMAAVKVVL